MTTNAIESLSRVCVLMIQEFDLSPKPISGTATLDRRSWVVMGTVESYMRLGGAKHAMRDSRVLC